MSVRLFPLLLPLLALSCSSPQAGDIDKRISELRDTTGNVQETDRVISEIVPIGESAGPKLIELFEDDDQLLNEAAVEALSRMPSTRTHLETAMLDTRASIRTRTHSILALDRMAHRDTFEALLVASKDPDARVRPYAIRAIGALKRPDSLDPLAEILRSGTKDDAAAAAIALGRLGDTRATALLVDALTFRPHEAKYAIITALGSLRDPTSVATLESLTASDRAQEVVMAVDSLGRIAATGDPGARDALHRIIRDTSSLGCLDAIQAIKPFADEADVPALKSALNSNSAHIRSAANEVLGLIAKE